MNRSTPKQAEQRQTGTGPRTLRGDVARLVTRYPRMARVGMAVAAIALSVGVYRGVEAASSSDIHHAQEQNREALEKARSFSSGTLRVGEGVRVYIAPDTRGADFAGDGSLSSGNQIQQGKVAEGDVIKVTDPIEYPDPDGDSTWYGFIDPTGKSPTGLAWVNSGATEQHRDDGKPYAKWVKQPESTSSVVVYDGTKLIGDGGAEIGVAMISPQ